jgi:hypothetical protein
MTTPDAMIGEFQTRIDKLNAVLKEAFEMCAQLKSLATNDDGTVNDEAAKQLSEANRKLQQYAGAAAMCNIVLGHLNSTKFCDVAELDAKFVPYFKNPAWPTCALNTASTCGKCGFKIFIDSKTLENHLSEMKKREKK